MDIKNEKIAVSQLALGMYISNLDRPWEGTPFMLQGFVLDNKDDIETLKSLCQFVYIDRSKSIGSHFASGPAIDVAIKRDISTIRAKNTAATSSVSTPITGKALGAGNPKVSFLDILKDLRSQPAGQSGVSPQQPQEGVMYNVRHVASSISSQSPKTTLEAKSNSIAQQLAEDAGGFFSALFRRDKAKNKVANSTKFENTKSSGKHDTNIKLTVFEEEFPVEQEIAQIYPVYEQSQIATRNIFEAVAHERELDLSAVSDILDNMVDSIGRSPDALLWLSKLKQTDNHAYNHALNVSITMMAFGNFLALSKAQVRELGLAGLLQDVGKIKISPDVLLKEGKLTREEYEYAKKHVDESLKILEKTPDIPMTTIEIVAQHHERANGSGYPKGLSESEIKLPSQIAGLIDVYCSITSNKSYAKAIYHQKALDEIYSLGGSLFSKELIDQLVQFMGIYPVSSLVELNTGEVALVIQQNQVRRLLPRLMVLLGPDKKRYQAPVILNLLLQPNTPTGEPYKIIKGIPPDSYGLSPEDFYI
ncbi:MAG TPA: HD-GYP domain-containing protein [Methylophilus sp.]|nr:HD-GYP domain-containing protein [Methylophilus sp.]HQQ33514.1 HD-GYP domain-containing protein [Methylophilus sp.]